MTEFIEVTYEMTLDVMSSNGGMTNAAAETLGITLPLPHGWRKGLVGKKFPALVWERAKELRNVPASEYRRLKREGGLEGPLLPSVRSIQPRERFKPFSIPPKPSGEAAHLRQLLRLLYDAMINGDPVRHESVLATDIRAAIGAAPPEVEELKLNMPFDAVATQEKRRRENETKRIQELAQTGPMRWEKNIGEPNEETPWR